MAPQTPDFDSPDYPSPEHLQIAALLQAEVDTLNGRPTPYWRLSEQSDQGDSDRFHGHVIDGRCLANREVDVAEDSSPATTAISTAAVQGHDSAASSEGYASQADDELSSIPASPSTLKDDESEAEDAGRILPPTSILNDYSVNMPQAAPRARLYTEVLRHWEMRHRFEELGQTIRTPRSGEAEVEEENGADGDVSTITRLDPRNPDGWMDSRIGESGFSVVWPLRLPRAEGNRNGGNGGARDHTDRNLEVVHGYADDESGLIFSSITRFGR